MGKVVSIDKARKRKKGGSSDWEKELAKKASKSSSREKSRGGGAQNRISIRKRRYTLGEEKFGREMNVVILDFVYLNTLYKGKFQEDKPNIPSCFSLSTDGEDMEPHKNVRKPPADACADCPMNEWGSGKGRAKACQGRRRLAVVHADDIQSAEDAAEAAIAIVELPVTSIKHWAKYIKQLDNELHRPLHSVITKMGFDEDESYPVPTFEVEKKIKDREIVDALEERLDEVRKMLMEPFDGTGGKDDDEDEDEDDEDDEDDDKKSRKSKSSKKRRRDEEEDDDDEDDGEEDDDDDDDDEEDEEEDEEDDEDDEEDEPKRKRAGRRGNRGGKRRSRDDDDDDDDEDEDDEDDDEDDEDEDEDEDEEDDEAPKRKKRSGSRFSKR